jgi:hypothetical protein
MIRRLVDFVDLLKVLEKQFRDKHEVYHIVVEFLKWLLELWRDYSLYPMVVYCVSRLVFVVTFSVRLEFIYFVMFMLIGIYLCCVYEFSFLFMIGWRRLLCFLYEVIMLGNGLFLIFILILMSQISGSLL